MNSNPALESFAAASRALAGSTTEPDWLQSLREESLTRFVTRGFPEARDERWKYTRLKSFTRSAYQLVKSEIASPDSLPARAFADLAAHRLVFVDGQLVTDVEHSDLPRGLHCRSLATALNGDNPDLQARIGAIARPELHPFTDLSNALLREGVVIEVDAGAEIERPVYLLFIATATKNPRVAAPRVLLDLGANARLSILEHHIGAADTRTFTNLCIEGRLQDGAGLEHYALQDQTGSGCVLSALHLDQQRDTRVIHHSIGLGGRMIRNDVHSRLSGRGAAIDLRGLYLAGDREHIDNHTLVEHCAAATSSSEDYKGVLHGRGRAVFNGKVLIHEGAAGSVAHQSNGNLLLSEQAEVNTKPELEIYNDDVKCSHGATVGQLDKQALFYLRSRGIDEETARIMLTFAFAESVLQGIPLTTVRERVEQSVIDLLPASERIRSFV